MRREQIPVPGADQLRYAPELAILASLEAALAATISALICVHPALLDDGVDPGERTLEIADAQAITRQAMELVASIHRYRPDVDERDDDPF